MASSCLLGYHPDGVLRAHVGVADDGIVTYVAYARNGAWSAPRYLAPYEVSTLRRDEDGFWHVGLADGAALPLGLVDVGAVVVAALLLGRRQRVLAHQ